MNRRVGLLPPAENLKHAEVSSKGDHSAHYLLPVNLALVVRPTHRHWRKVPERSSVRHRFGSPFSSKKVVVCGHCLVTLSLTSGPTETLKPVWLSSLHIESLCRKFSGQWSDSVAIGISVISPPSPPPPPPPYSPSLINLMVPVDVKHHVYLLPPRKWCQECESSSGW